MLSKDEILELIKEDIENKKDFPAKWPAQCDVCGEAIDKGDSFIFMGEKKKICTPCIDVVVKAIHFNLGGD